MASPTIDGSAAVIFTGVGSANVTLTTAHSNDIIALMFGADVHVNSGNVTVNTIISTSGLVFTQRGTITNSPVTYRENMEFWYAKSPLPLTAENIQIFVNNRPDDAGVIVFGVNGVGNLDAPFDTDPSLPKTGTRTTTSLDLVYSTQTSETLIVGMGAHYQGSIMGMFGGSNGTYTNIGSVRNTGGSNFQNMRADYLAVSTPQTSQTITFPNYTALVGMVDAFTASSMTVPSSGGGGGGGGSGNVVRLFPVSVGFRDFPTSENREFPTT